MNPSGAVATATLFAPAAYWRLSPAAKAEICNGCGPKGFGLLVPNRMWGLDISPACDIHDYQYLVGRTIEDKMSADRAFLNNLLRLIEAPGRSRLLKPLRRRRALKYYEAVYHLGGPAFWAGKNREDEECAVSL